MEQTVEFSASARKEIDAYVTYYEDLQEGLGLRFRMEIDRHVTTLKSMPFMNKRYDSIRCVPVSGFPYMIHYSVLADRNLIRIHAVIHTARNPLTSWNSGDWLVSERKRPAYGLHAYDMEYYYAA